MWAVCRPVVCTPVLVAQQEVGILVRVVCRPAVCRPGVSAPQETCRSLRMIKGTGCACTRLPCHRTRPKASTAHSPAPCPHTVCQPSWAEEPEAGMQEAGMQEAGMQDLRRSDQTQQRRSLPNRPCRGRTRSLCSSGSDWRMPSLGTMGIRSTSSQTSP